VRASRAELSAAVRREPEDLIAASVQWAEAIMRKIDSRFNEGRSKRTWSYQGLTIMDLSSTENARIAVYKRPSRLFQDNPLRIVQHARFG
jgi:hypothetical protein